MTIRRITAVAVLLAFASATLLSVAAAGPQLTKQRVSILATFNVQTGFASWELIPLTRGPLKRDSGTSNGGGSFGRTTLIKGQRVTPIVGSDRNTGKRGTFDTHQTLVSTDVGSRYSADIGTWKLMKGTGAYKGVTGGGRFAAVGLPGGTVIINQEGWVTVG